MRCIISQFHVVEVVFKDQPLLVQSLKELGYNPTICKEGQVLGGNYNRDKVKANIIIPRTQFGGVYGDLGFEKTKKGFIMHADHIDLKKFNLKGLNMKYCENKLKKYVSATSRCSIFSRKENKNGSQIEIHLRLQQ